MDLRITLDRDAPGPLNRQLADAILREIRLGGLRPGDRLPPTRMLAERLGVTRGTVSSAYERLVAEGVLHGHVGRGTFVAVSPPRGEPAGEPIAAPRWSDLFAGAAPPPRARYPETGAAPVIPFHRNVPDAALFPVEAFRIALDEVMRESGSELLGYAPAEGYPGFTDFLVDHVRSSRGVSVAPDEVLVVNGSQQALDLIGRAFLRPGDTVAVEDPTYTGALEILRGFEARVVTVATDAGGLRLDDAERVFARERPRFLYTMPTYQNPTGRSLADERREGLVRLAARYGIPLVEDDFDGELGYEEHTPPPLKSLAESRGVIYIGTPSKMLFPGLRIGWILADPAVVERLGRLKQVADLSSSQLLQAAFARFAASGELVRHRERVRTAYAARRDRLLAALERHLPRGSAWTRPRGGMSLMVTLPEGVTGEAVLRETAPHGVLFAPGSWFSPGNGARHLRLCYGAVADEAIEPGVEILARAAKAVRARARRGRGATEAALPSV